MTRPGELRLGVSKGAATESKNHFVARPIVALKIEGDFELTVRVTHAPPEAKDLAAVGEGELIASAGIALYSPDTPKASVVLLHRHFKERDTWKSTFWTSPRLAGARLRV